jgi:NAD(P)-dependent dehydrogenase (short-subunit alcohol dehydrogenase family)
MKVLVIGATGEVGRAVVEAALAAGHETSVYVRSPEKLGDLRSRLSVCRGEVTDAERISEAVGARTRRSVPSARVLTKHRSMCPRLPLDTSSRRWSGTAFVASSVWPEEP